MDVHETQARVQLAAHLYRRVVLVLAQRLAQEGAPPLTAEEKMRLHAEVEPAAWALPTDVFEGDASEEWLERALEDPRAQRLVRERADALLAARDAPSTQEAF